MNDNASSVEGGYVLVPCRELCRAWTAYRKNKIKLYDLRVWLACHELVARRCTLGKGRSPEYSHAELHTLVGGVGGEHVRKSLRHLEAAGLLCWSSSSITFASAQAESDEVALMLDQVKNHRRAIPVPRRMLRYLACKGSRSLIATAIGHLFRCLYVRGQVLRPVGACKSSWIAATFGINARNAKAARRTFIELGWLTPQVAPQWYRNRYGSRIRINTEWALAGEGRSCSCSLALESSPPPRKSTTESSPPVANRKLLPEYKNQKPADRRPAGACSSKVSGTKPTLKDVKLDDLQQSTRLLALFRQAVESGLLAKTESDRLRFFAAAEHAKSHATANACGLFMHLVRHKLWHFLTQADEDAAQRRLSALREKLRRATPAAPVTATANVGGLFRISDYLPDILRCAAPPELSDAA